MNSRTIELVKAKFKQFRDEVKKMTGYLISFLVYTSAMVGVIFLALFVFKTFSSGGFSKKSSSLNIEETMKLSARKTLYVINAQNERFLIAADIDRTSLIAKLDTKSEKEQFSTREDKSTKLSSFDGIESLSEFASLIDFQKERSQKESMMRGLAKKLNAI